MGRKYYLNTYGGAECYFSVNPLAGHGKCPALRSYKTGHWIQTQRILHSPSSTICQTRSTSNATMLRSSLLNSTPIR